MAEFFDISFIAKKTPTSKLEMELCVKSFDMSIPIDISDFNGSKIVSYVTDDDTCDYEEFNVGIEKFSFSEKNFESKIVTLTKFVQYFFDLNRNIKYAFCSFELNGYILSQIKTFKTFSRKSIQNRFPISYVREKKKNSSVIQLNLSAQNIF